jgi:light-harvesting complex I chlorophyll a/b binding protein 1
MATAMACTRVAAAAIVGGAQTSRFYVGSSSAASGGRRLGCSNGSRVSMAAQWLPGQPRPSYLDGSAPGDFGFDPLGLGEVPENLERYKESELIHCRWAMLAIVSLLFSIDCCLSLLGLSYLDFSNSHTESS